MLIIQEPCVDVTSVKWRPESGDGTIACGLFVERNATHEGSYAVMRNFKIVFGVVVLVLAVMMGWQVASWELADIQFQDELQDMGSMAGAHIGVVVPLSDEEVVRAVIHKAGEHGIELDPDQVTVQHIGSGEKSTMYLAADYRVPVKVLFFSFKLHFTPSSRR
jgi:hypothetical protein